MDILSFFKKLLAKIKSIFNGLPADLKQAIHIGVVITDNFKNFVESPVADVLTAIIPGDIDDRIKQTLRIMLPAILLRLTLIDVKTDTASNETIVGEAVKAFHKLDPSISPAFLHTFSILIAQVAADGKLSWSDGAILVEWYYKNKYKAA